jgi:hypothetical protein
LNVRQRFEQRGGFGDQFLHGELLARAARDENNCFTADLRDSNGHANANENMPAFFIPGREPVRQLSGFGR